MKQYFKKTLALLLVFMLIASVIPGASVAKADAAFIDLASMKGSITLYKYASTVAAPNPDVPDNESSSGQTESVDTTKYVPVENVPFAIYQLAGYKAVLDYYNGRNSGDYSANDLPEDAERYGEIVYSDSEGKVEFTNLPVGFYVVKELETNMPLQITTPLINPFLVSIPMVNSVNSDNDGTTAGKNNDWIYDVVVYPKNHESRGNVDLTKWQIVANGSRVGLQGVEFKLERQAVDAADKTKWDLVTSYTLDSSPAPTANQTTAPTTTVPYGSFITDAKGHLRIDNLPSGLNGMIYRLTEISAPEGNIVNDKPILFTVKTDNTIELDSKTFENTAVINDNTKTYVGSSNTPANFLEDTTKNTLFIQLDNLQPDVEKTVKLKTPDAKGNTHGAHESFQFTDTIEYKVEVDVPTNVAELATFMITDAPSAGISVNLDSIKVAYGANTLLAGTHYEKAENEDENVAGDGFVLTFTDAGKSAIANAGKVTITYTANFNENVVIDGQGNANVVTLTYSSKTNDPDAPNYNITDEVTVFTYKYQITKYLDSIAEGNQVDSRKNQIVQFELYSKDKKVIPVEKLANGNYRLIQNPAAGANTIMETNDAGTIMIEGLDDKDGIYYLKEVKTITGYNLLSDYFQITVNSGRTTDFTETGDQFATNVTTQEKKNTYVTTYGTAYYNEGKFVANSNVINRRGTVLPQTGSMGYLLFCTAGLVLVAGGALLMFSGRKRSIR